MEEDAPLSSLSIEQASKEQLLDAAWWAALLPFLALSFWP